MFYYARQNKNHQSATLVVVKKVKSLVKIVEFTTFNPISHVFLQMMKIKRRGEGDDAAALVRCYEKKLL